MSLSFGSPVQVAWVTNDLSSTETALTGLLAVKKWVRLPDIPFAPDTCRYLGGPDGDQVYPFPCTGNETVLDAIGNINGLTGLAEGTVTVHRKGKPGEPDQTLPVDWKAVTGAGNAATNYPLQPGDRAYIKRKK